MINREGKKNLLSYIYNDIKNYSKDCRNYNNYYYIFLKPCGSDNTHSIFKRIDEFVSEAENNYYYNFYVIDNITHNADCTISIYASIPCENIIDYINIFKEKFIHNDSIFFEDALTGALYTYKYVTNNHDIFKNYSYIETKYKHQDEKHIMIFRN